jgi:hypothetical protein
VQNCINGKQVLYFRDPLEQQIVELWHVERSPKGPMYMYVTCKKRGLQRLHITPFRTAAKSTAFWRFKRQQFGKDCTAAPPSLARHAQI